jgi:hypothetical protein
MRSIGFLDYDQPLGSKAKTFIDQGDADRLVLEMFAERISRKLIRAFPPDSPFRRLQPTKTTNVIKLPPREVENCYFVPPPTDQRPRLNTLRAGWDWSHEGEEFFRVSARSRSTQQLTAPEPTLASPLLAG